MCCAARVREERKKNDDDDKAGSLDCGPNCPVVIKIQTLNTTSDPKGAKQVFLLLLTVCSIRLAGPAQCSGCNRSVPGSQRRPLTSRLVCSAAAVCELRYAPLTS